MKEQVIKNKILTKNVKDKNSILWVNCALLETQNQFYTDDELEIIEVKKVLDVLGLNYYSGFMAIRFFLRLIPNGT